MKYFYDSIYRLGQAVSNDASSSWGISWTFDTWGNRLTQTPQGLATSKVGSQTLGYTNNRNTSFTYDAAGNQTNEGLHSYTFNAENQITQMDGGAAIYGYDGEGRRVKKTVGSETTYYFYGAGGIISEFTTNSGVTQANSADRTTYRTSERTGTAVLLIASSGTVTENNRTLPYGEAWLSDVASMNNKKFTAYDRDSESGLDYAMQRYYAGSSGRFVGVDLGSMSFPRPNTLNRYIYAASDPLNKIDPGGLEAIDLNSENAAAVSRFARAQRYGFAVADKKEGPWQSPPILPPEEETPSFTLNSEAVAAQTDAPDVRGLVCGSSYNERVLSTIRNGAILGGISGAIGGAIEGGIGTLPGAVGGALAGAFLSIGRGVALAEACVRAGAYGHPENPITRSVPPGPNTLPPPNR